MKGFDPSRARPERLAEAAASTLVDLLPIPADPWTIDHYREAMRRGELFPPIAVVRVFGWLLVADGHKRLAAWRTLGREDLPIPIELWSWANWLGDQLHQAGKTLWRLLRLPWWLVTDPTRAWREGTAAPRHWWRVARSLPLVLRRRP